MYETVSNYYEQTRSNYFKVKDKEAFQKFLDRFVGAVELIEDDKGRVGFLAPEGIPSEWPVTDADGMEESVEVDFLAELAKHLARHEVAVIVGNGYEKMRYLTGFAVAVNGKDERRSVNIESIYELAKKLTKQPKRITRAEY